MVYGSAAVVHDESTCSTTETGAGPLSPTPQTHPTCPPHHQEDTIAMEHRMFCRATLSLLAQVEADTGNPDVIRMGRLKKSSRRIIKGRWKQKFVEIRRGMFSYYEEGKSGSRITRKDIPLSGSLCSVIPSSSSSGVVFELRVKGGGKRLWMATSREDRAAWVEAIRRAMAGPPSAVVDGYSPAKRLPDSSPYSMFAVIRDATSSARSKEEYLQAIELMRDKSLQVPVNFVKVNYAALGSPGDHAQTDVTEDLAQMWKDLRRDFVDVNGRVLSGEPFPEPIMGSLALEILSRYHGNDVTESQAVSCARDVLLACDRTKSSGDSYLCAENLCLNRDMVVLCPASTGAKPISIRVFGKKKALSSPRDIRGWVRSRIDEDGWDNLFFVLSDRVLSCYSKSETKPHHLLREIQMDGTSISAAAQESGIGLWHALCIRSNDGKLEQEFRFDDDFDFSLWKASLREAAAVGGGDEAVNDAAETAPKAEIVVSVINEYKVQAV
ncbi:hypothetical protein THAOC_04263 [Thalassiosira oceanica]|uniref:PH domain-containing protein n=1 Tax=Thalassiosira oceanica TaxID=159749 RepID=K0TJJ1_THAOC|nr:hypothetical protein THAOC_04263 [Thalassiosira oceanica]|eukprot:EJK74081.1 hypothetical protein THAOC_04263 [Thalassiosira oceanica]